MQFAIEKRCEFDYGFGAHYKCMWHRTEGNHQVVIDTSNLMNSNRIIFFPIQEMNMANGFKWKQQHRFYVELNLFKAFWARRLVCEAFVWFCF